MHKIAMIIILILLIGCAKEHVQLTAKNITYNRTSQHDYQDVSVMTKADFIRSIREPMLIIAQPLLEKISHEDMQLRVLASSMTKGCVSGDKECQLEKVYRYVVENFDYYSDPRTREFIQSPNQTIDIRGGDCEDLTILMVSLLENLGYTTYIVLADDHVYALACGIDMERLFTIVEQSMKKLASEETMTDEGHEISVKDGHFILTETDDLTISLNPGQMRYFGGDGGELPEEIDHLDVSYSISSTSALDIYFLPSNEEYIKISEGKDIKHYQNCQRSSTYRITDSCDYLQQRGGLLLVNTDYRNSARVDLEIKYSQFFSLLMLDNMRYYSIDAEQCVVLETTAGKYGYPGYRGEIYNGTAIDPVTKKIYDLK